MAQVLRWLGLVAMSLAWGRIGLDFLFYFLGFREAGLSKPAGILLGTLGLLGRLWYEIAEGIERQAQQSRAEAASPPNAWEAAYFAALHIGRDDPPAGQNDP